MSQPTMTMQASPAPRPGFVLSALDATLRAFFWLLLVDTRAGARFSLIDVLPRALLWCMGTASVILTIGVAPDTVR